jgi:hypothetical protein
MSNNTKLLVDSISALVAAELMNTRLKNTEAAAALSKAKDALAEKLEQWKRGI